MMFVEALLNIIAIVSLLMVLGVIVFVIPNGTHNRFRSIPSQVKAVLPITIVLVGVLLFNGIARQVVPDASWIIGWNITWEIYRLEGALIVWIQSFETQLLTSFFSFIYVYGYGFVLVFPLLIYLLHPSSRPLEELLTAYTLNYVFGLLLYTLIIAYGPRNLMPELVDALLYDTYPRYQHLTRQVNRNTNVFPSLHVSLAVTVAAMAYRTRPVYRGWFPVATGIALAISISTMYLGIHWAIDVIAGIILGLAAVWMAAVVVRAGTLRRIFNSVVERIPR